MSFKKIAMATLALAAILGLAMAGVATARHTTVKRAPFSKVGLVVAYAPAPLAPNPTPPPPFICTGGKTLYFHGSPLVAPACGPVTPLSTSLTTGTKSPRDDGVSSTFGPQMTASAEILDVLDNPSTTTVDESDVTIKSTITDVRCKIASTGGKPCDNGVLSDYTGKVLLQAKLRITDHYNARPGVTTGCSATTTCTATVADLPFSVPIDCVAVDTTPGTPDPKIGATCSTSTTANSLVPGTVKKGRVGNTELSGIVIKDSGPNLTGYGAGCPPTCGDGDETEYLKQGIFTP